MEKELLNKIKIEKEKLLQDDFKIIGVFGSYTKNTQTKQIPKLKQIILNI